MTENHDGPTQELQEKMVEMAQEVLLRGVIQGQMSPDNAQHQIIVAGAMIILAAAHAGISLAEAFANVAGIDPTTGEPRGKSDNGDGHPGQYL